MTEQSRLWGVLPSYYGWQGDLVETSGATEAAILESMGARTERPPRVRRPHHLDREACIPGPDRAWGWAVQLYALRSRESWGIGDFADLRDFGRWARSTGASVVLLNPLGAQNPVLPYQPSPYYSSTRRFRNAVLLRVDEVQGAAEAPSFARLRHRAVQLNDQRVIDYDRVFELKSAVLQEAFRAAPRPRGLAAYARREGFALRDFATFCAICEERGPAWRDWPEELRHPRAHGVAQARRRLARSVEFHAWLQFHIDRQLGRAGKEIGLIADVPVGFAADGFDSWRWQDYLAPEVRVGAPPDEFFRDGQDWGLPAFNPWKLGDARWEPFSEAIRSAAGHAGGVRLDHVMGLFRLFWIPTGMHARQGAYVRYPAVVLLSLLADESRRSGAFVIGEDLGLVEPAVRKHLARRGSLSYRLVWFEGSDPAAWPHDAVGAVGTHDLPTIAGIWTGSEPEHRLHHLRNKLVELTHLPDDTDPIDVAIATYDALARGRPRVVLASLEDALGVHERPNEPGTTTERPNWRLALPQSLGEIKEARGPLRIAEAMRSAGR